MTKVRVEGGLAVVMFINLDWTAKFMGDGNNTWLRDADWRW